MKLKVQPDALKERQVKYFCAYTRTATSLLSKLWEVEADSVCSPYQEVLISIFTLYELQEISWCITPA